MPNIYDVANHSGVSIATVSYVINNGPKKVTAVTRQRVLKAMRALEYIPSALPAGKTRKTMRTVGVLFKDLGIGLMDNPYLPLVLQGIVRGSDSISCSVLLFGENMWEDAHQDARLFVDGHCDGLIITAPPTDSPVVAALQERGVPLVLVNADHPDPDIATLGIDNFHAIDSVVEHLVTLGHTRIAYLGGEHQFLDMAEREKAFRASLHSRGMEVNEALVVQGRFYSDSGYERTRHLLSVRPAGARPTAIVCGNDQIAFGVLKAAREMRIAVPKKLSVTGFDDISQSSFVSPSLTTLRQPLIEMGRVAVEMLHAIALKKPMAGIKKTYSTDLIVRESSGPVPKSNSGAR